MSVWSKIYERINWKDLPQRLTALAARNLNKMDLAIDTLDDRTIGLNTRLEAVEENPITVDTELKPDSENPVQNKVIYAAFEDLLPEETAQGNPISISDASGLNAKACTVDLLPIQDLSQGEPSPTNICPISGRTEVSVTRTGKNLSSVNTVEGVSWADTNVTLNNILNSLKVGTYTLSFTLTVKTVTMNGNWAYGINALNANGGVFKMVSMTTNPTVGYTANVTHTFTITEENKGGFTTCYLYGCGANGVGAMGTADFTKVQIEIGSTATTYEPYQGETVTKQLGQTVYGGTLDVTNGKLTIEENVIDLSSLTWTKVTNNVETPYFSSNAISNSYFESARDFICSDYSYGRIASTGNEEGLYAVANTFAIRIRDSRYASYTADQFKTAMSGVQFGYKLATPTEITLTAEQISLLKGNNVISTDGDNIILKYSADIKAWVENQLSA